MAKNQRQRRPLQEDKRTDKKDVRERQQQSRRQRDRIEENRDRRELRRERERLRRTTVDSVRSPKEDLRTERTESRLVPIEDTFLGRPTAIPNDLPVIIGERYGMSGGVQSLANATFETIECDTAVFTTERNGYPQLYDPSTFLWTIPAGLTGVWYLGVQAYHIGNGTTFACNVRWFLNGATQIVISEERADSTSGISAMAATTYLLHEGDYLEPQAAQYSGGANDIAITTGYTYAEMIFLGK